MLPGRRDGVGRLYINAAVPPAPPQSPIQSGGVLWTLNGAATVVNGAVVLDGVVGTYVSTPDSPADNVTGNIDIRAYFAATNWIAGVNAQVIGNLDQVGTLGGYRFIIVAANTLRLDIVEGGVVRTYGGPSVAANVNGQAYRYRATRRASDGKVDWYSSVDGVNWIFISTITAFPGSIQSTTVPITMGQWNAGGGANLTGKIYEAEIRNGIDGPVAVSFNAADAKFNAGAYMGGIQLSPTGQVYVTAAPAVSDTYDNGFRVSALGQLVITPGGIVASFQEGLPRDSNSAVVTLANGTPVALPDGSYNMLGGLSIANTGLYTTDATPSIL